MAQRVDTYTPLGSIEVYDGLVRIAANLTPDANVAVLALGERIYDGNGDVTNIRGVRVLIETAGLTPPAVTPTPVPSNVPTIWYEGQEIQFHTDSKYTFFGGGIVTYGIKVS